MYISSVTLNFEISRSKVKILERVFNLYFSIYLTFIYFLMFRRAPVLLIVTHPVLMAYVLIGYAILVRIRLRTLSIRWFIYLLVLIFLGGVIILIIYITSMAANEKFNSYLKTRLRKIILGGALLIISIVFMPIIEKVIFLENTPTFLISLMESRSRLIYF